MQMTATAKTWLDGVKAFQAGASRDANPFSKMAITTDTAIGLSIQWFSGWDSAAIITNPKAFGTVVAGMEMANV